MIAADDRVNILLVDDQPANLLALESILEDMGQNLVKAESGRAALRALLVEEFAVILLDVQMPDLNGCETASLIRERDKSRDTPIIFLTALSRNETNVFRGYEIGAVDYIFRCSEGIPRNINNICDNALLNGFAASASVVSRAMIEEIAGTFDMLPRLDRQPSATSDHE